MAIDEESNELERRVMEGGNPVGSFYDAQIALASEVAGQPPLMHLQH